MQAATATTRFSAKLYHQTANGKVFKGTVLVTIDDSTCDLTSLSNNFSLEDFIKVDELPAFNIFDFPDTADLPNIDLQTTQPIIDQELDFTDIGDLREPDLTIDDENTFNFVDFQEEALVEDDNEFVPIHHPVSLAGVKVNRKGEIILQNEDEEAAKTLRIRFMDLGFIKQPHKNNNLHLISKENKGKYGPVVAFDVYRNGTWLKACDLHLPTEIIKTFREPFRLDEIEVIHYDGDYNNCHLNNLVAKVKNNVMDHSPMNVLLTDGCVQAKMWNGNLIPNYFTSIHGEISLFKHNTVLKSNIGSASTCYVVHMHGMKSDARKVVWRSFTDETPEYSESHYKVHIIDKTRKDPLSFDNLLVTVESSTFDQWTKENESWPWKRSSKGNVPKQLRDKTKKKNTRKEAAKTKKAQTPTASLISLVPRPSKKTAAPAKIPEKKYIKRISEKEFQQLRHLVKMNLTISPKQRQLYLEQRTLRRLHAYLG